MISRVPGCIAVSLMGLLVSGVAVAECAISEESKQLDPVEVGFCESDAVFIGKVEARLETVRAYTPDGGTTTKHYRIESSTLSVAESYKGKLPEKVTLTADLYDKQASAFSFANGKEYLVFAKRQAGKEEFTGASAACSVQPTLLLTEATTARAQLAQHKNGARKIDCRNIRKKSP